MVTVLALPINIVAGLLGMNVGGVPLADSPHGFMVIVAIIGEFTGFAAWYVYRQKQ
jgi:zinc transporter